jgi:hypothetical protein
MTPRTHIRARAAAKAADLQRAERARRRALIALTAVVAAAAVWMLVAAPRALADNGANGFSVEPMMFGDDQLTISPGHSRTVTVQITNTTEDRQTYGLGTEDIEGDATDPNLNPVLLGTTVPSPISAADWIHPAAGGIELGAGHVRAVKVEVDVPTAASGAHYAALTITSQGHVEDGGTITAQSRVAVLFFINAGGVPPPEIVIEHTHTTTGGQTTFDWHTQYVQGQAPKPIKPQVQIEYVDPITGQTVKTVTNGTCTTGIPDTSGVESGTCTVDSPGTLVNNPFGTGHVGLTPVVTLTSDGRRTSAHMPTKWAGSWTSMLLPITGITLLILWFARRRRREEEEEEDVLAV